MFKRRFSRKFPKRSVIPARKIPRSIARVRTDWVTVYNPMEGFPGPPDGPGCSYLAAAFIHRDDACFSSFNFEVMSAVSLSTKYGDDVKIVAIKFDLYMRPVFQAGDLCNVNSLAAFREATDDWAIVARGGLYKQRVVDSNRLTDGSAAHPGYSQDWSDAGALQSFQKVWLPPPRRYAQNTFNDGQTIGPCSNVHQAGYTVPAYSSGSGPTYNVPALSTDCDVTYPSGESCLEGSALTDYVQPGWKLARLNRRRPVHMHEDDTIGWQVDWGPLNPPVACGFNAPVAQPCAMQLIPFMKLKLQYG